MANYNRIMPIPFIIKTAKGLNLKSMKDATLWSKIMHGIMMRKAKIVWGHVGKYVVGKKILDVGMGSGSISYFLNKKELDVKSVDVANLSIYDDLKPIIYDGTSLPFKKNEFDTAMIIHVLHHCSDGIRVLQEAKRCSKRLIFIEDTYRNKMEWFFVGAFDAITNGELWWHKYRTVSEWKKIIKNNGWKVVSSSAWSESGITSPYGRYCMFVIE